MLEVLTHFNKIDRVSRVIDPDNFVATPGIWAEVDDDGSLVNITTDTPAPINKLVIGNRSSNIYESHDTSVGRITTMETIGIRVKVDSEGYAGTVNKGNSLIVSVLDAQEGKLVDAVESDALEPAGDYEVVARCEEVNDTEGYIVYKTVSPTILAITGPAPPP